MTKESLSSLIESYLIVYFQQEENAMDLKNLHPTLIQAVEKPLIHIVLKHTQYNQKQAAEILGLNRNTLRKKIITLGVEVKHDASSHP